MQSLGSRHINSISQGSDDESGTISEVLITVVKDSVGNIELVILFSFVPITLELGLPLEIIDLGDALIAQFLNDITRVSVHSDHAHNLLTHASGQLTLHHLNQICKKVDLVIKSLSHCVLFEGNFDILDPVHQVDE